MPTLRDHLATLRGRIQKGRYDGPPILVEGARANEEILVRPPREVLGSLRQTRPVDASLFRARDRTEPVFALVDIVAPTSRAFDIVKGPSGDPGDPLISIGRNRDNDIVILDDTMSARHASIEIQESSAILRDAGSSNGTFVNQEPLGEGAQIPLDSGDCVRFGQRVFYYLSGGRIGLFLDAWSKASASA